MFYDGRKKEHDNHYQKNLVKNINKTIVEKDKAFK